MDDFRAAIPDFFYPAIPGLPTTPFPISTPFIPDCQPLHSRLPTPSFPIANPFIPDFYPAIPGRQPRSFPLSLARHSRESGNPGGESRWDARRARTVSRSLVFAMLMNILSNMNGNVNRLNSREIRKRSNLSRGALILGRVDIRLIWTIAALPPPIFARDSRFLPAVPDFYPVIPAKAGIHRFANAIETPASA